MRLISYFHAKKMEHAILYFAGIRICVESADVLAFKSTRCSDEQSYQRSDKIQIIVASVPVESLIIVATIQHPYNICVIQTEHRCPTSNPIVSTRRTYPATCSVSHTD